MSSPFLTAVARELITITALHFLNRGRIRPITPMKLYKTTALIDPEHDDTTRTRGVWCTSGSDASKARTALKKKDRHCDPQTVEVDVPTTRAELVAFLNQLCKDETNEEGSSTAA